MKLLEFSDITIEVLNKNKNYNQKRLKILSKASGAISSGQLTAVMGPSGGGKTTLLNCLAGRIPPGSITSGSVLFDNKLRNASDWLHRCAYIDQDDQIFELLTVEETIMSAAEFRLPGVSRCHAEERVKELMRVLNLSEVSKNQMKKLSGGQRKRTMIAVELITDPQVIFLDEPTSGLDTNTANSLISFLKGLAEQGKMVVFSVHQPSLEAFFLFDKLVLVSRSKIAYSGEPSGIIEELNKLNVYKREHASIPDFIIEVANSGNSENSQNIEYENAMHKLITLHEQAHNSEKATTSSPTSKNDYYVEYGVNIKHIYYLMLRRMKEDSKRIIMVLFKSLVLPLLFHFLIIVALRPYDDYKIGKHTNFYPYTLYIYLIIAMTCVIPSSAVFYPESKLIKREVGVGTYSTTSYCLSIYFYQLVKNLLRNAIPCCYLLVYAHSSAKACIFCLYIMVPLFGVLSGIIFGSFTDNKRISILMSSILTMIFFTFYIIMLISNYGMVTFDSNYYLYLYYTAMFLINVFTPSNFVLLLLMAPLNNTKLKLFTFFGMKYNFSFILIWNILSLPLFLMISLLLLGRIQRPSIRMSLSSQKK